MNTTPILVWHVPVLHQGYVSLLERLSTEFAPAKLHTYLMQPGLVTALTGIKSDPATLEPKLVQTMFATLGWQSSAIESSDLEGAVAELRQLLQQHPLVIMIDDQVSRELWHTIKASWPATTALPTIRFESVFLRWDSDKVQQITQFATARTSDLVAQKWMQKAQKVAQKSSDWWRQVGAIVVKNDSEVLTAYNQGMPTDHTPYQQGAVRDVIPTGQQPELANYIHAEQAIIATAAARGISLGGTDLYVTHFPCPVCAKLIAKAGFKRVLFATGSASLDGQQVLESYQVTLLQVSNKKPGA